MALHVAAAPAAAPATFTSAVWDHGVEQAQDLVNAIASLEAVRQEIEGRLSDAAWEMDCAVLRHSLAVHGSGLLRWLSAKRGGAADRIGEVGAAASLRRPLPGCAAALLDVVAQATEGAAVQSGKPMSL